MKFGIERASTRHNPEVSLPCNEAEKIYQTKVDSFLYKSFEEYEKRTGRSFLAIGTNHRVTESGIRREIPDSLAGWTVDLDSLEDLLRFVAKYGNVVLYTDNSILIYDDYIE